MRKIVLSGLIVLICSAFISAQDASEKDSELAAIKQAALDYVDGFYSGSVERLERGIHPSLQKVMVRPINKDREVFSFTDREMLIQVAAAGMGKVPEDKRNIEVTVFHHFKNIAVTKIDSLQFVDYAHVARINGEWKVVNVLWQMQKTSPAEITEEDKAAIKQAAMDYVDGYFEGSGERNKRGVHPSLHKVVVRKLPNGTEFLYRIDRDSLVQISSAGLGKLPEAERNIGVEIFDTFDNIATIGIPSAKFVDCAHVAKINGKWQIVNVLWTPQDK